MRDIRRSVGAVAATLALALGPALPATGTAHALSSRTFTWNKVMRAGDCTMFEGARWTLYSDGTATFDGTVTSGDDNDAWLMWAYLKDADNAVLGTLTNYRVQDPTDRNKFVKNLPSETQRYRWFASGRFDARKFPLIRRMSLGKHC
ncbi:hypothetical protein GCM10022252_24080 [Streptosporangium oxazolinicum]|uniref:DUF6294 domain-containing protein n=1 Tax=Streptosporangium oxazolinicum TaxID=909287 RepID=A0ABP8AR70_9ACTN